MRSPFPAPVPVVSPRGPRARRGPAGLVAALLAFAAAACGGDGDGPDDGDDGVEDDGDDGQDDGDDGDGGPANCPDGDVLELLEAIPGLTVTEERIEAPHRFFRIEIEQPVDHGEPDGASFQQRFTLRHRDSDAPMVLHTTGYYGVGGPFQAELTGLFDANQVDVEQRYFSPSRPDPTDWSLMTIEQAAADHHRIVEALEPIYCNAWLATGASKGGMTSVYHRRFYPDDVDGTVAYVAPLSFGAPDDSYQPFFDEVADEPCRAGLRDFQRELLMRRAAMVEFLAAEGDLAFERLGGIEGAFEDAVIEFTWGFWQYLDASVCELVPTPAATDPELWDFFVSAGGIAFIDDATIEAYETYYYQAETQLGFPSSPRAHLEDLLETQEIPRDYLPDGVTATYDDGVAMTDIDEWVQSEGERLLFVYGEYDPWGAGPFALGDARDSFLYFAPQANHGANIADLGEDDRTEALDALSRWTGVEPQISAFSRNRELAEPGMGLPPPPGK